MEKHWIWLTTRKGIGPVGRAALIRLFGSAERVYALTEEMCRSTCSSMPMVYAPKLSPRSLFKSTARICKPP